VKEDLVHCHFQDDSVFEKVPDNRCAAYCNQVPVALRYSFLELFAVEQELVVVAEFLQGDSVQVQAILCAVLAVEELHFPIDFHFAHQKIPDEHSRCRWKLVHLHEKELPLL
jgi:hypothetical protein